MYLLLVIIWERGELTLQHQYIRYYSINLTINVTNCGILKCERNSISYLRISLQPSLDISLITWNSSRRLEN